MFEKAKKPEEVTIYIDQLASLVTDLEELRNFTIDKVSVVKKV